MHELGHVYQTRYKLAIQTWHNQGMAYEGTRLINEWIWDGGFVVASGNGTAARWTGSTCDPGHEVPRKKI